VPQYKAIEPDTSTTFINDTTIQPEIVAGSGKISPLSIEMEMSEKHKARHSLNMRKAYKQISPLR